MNFKLIFRFLGFINVFMAIALLLPVPFGLYYKDGGVQALFISSLINAVLGGAVLFFTRHPDRVLRAREGFFIVVAGWMIFSLFGSMPYTLSGAIPNWLNAYFETMSGFSTTGATILEEIESLPHAILFWRSLTHWIGGMGIILLSLAILPFIGVGGLQLFKAEVPGPITDKIQPRLADTAKVLWGIYVLLTVVEVVFLLFGGMNLFDALCHSFGTLATGGFSTKNASIAEFKSSYIDYVIIIFMLLAATNFSLHYQLLKGDGKAFYKNVELRVFLIVIAVATLIIGTDIFINNYDYNFADALRYSLFQVTSISTTTGFGTADYEQWSMMSQSILFTLMYVGGCIGSTSGGLKILRIYLLFRFSFGEIKKMIHPNAVISTRIGNTVVSEKTMSNIFVFFFLYIFISVVAAIIIMAFQGSTMSTAFGAVAATINGVGPGLNAVGPTDNFAFFHPVPKLVLTFLMILGRLDIFTIIILLTPSFWKK